MNNPPHHLHSRRDFLATAAGGFGGMALSSLMASDMQAVVSHAPKANAVIQIFCSGGLSHVDTWDYKPELERRAGTPFDPDGKLQFFASKPGNCQPSFWKFRQHGQSGLWLSDLLPRLATCIDDIAFVYSMQSKTALHGPGNFMMNTGQTMPGFPSMGAWVTYGLGSSSENLPGFVVLPDVRGLPPGGIINWGAGFLPAKHQATTLDTSNAGQPIADLFPPKAFRAETKASDKPGLNFLQKLNQLHRKPRAGNTELDARIKAYEMAARLQLSAPEVSDLRGETEATKRLYDIENEAAGPFGRQCLLARRMVERGVRFVQIYCGAENTTAEKIRPNWDSHEDLPRDHGYWGEILDTGAAALLKDLKSRGLLDQTLVICTTEFGRQPAAQGKQAKGRDHNGGAFTAWMAGGGVKGGVGYGASDELGFKAADNIVHSYELHATALHLLGLDHEKLTWYHNGLEQRLTGFEGYGVIHKLLA
ncbi:MAG: sulfatase [Verrucomicrobiales bacterium]|nr:sulfatase [Verrucomicrobiales bacterium]|tara:strand:- start:2951 stop:4381 length:1431 start_codon:yes stop_codon:yes gene_type:complete